MSRGKRINAKKILLILLFSLFVVNICYASSDSPDIIGTINFHNSSTGKVDMSFNYKDKAFYFSTVPISEELLDLKQKITPNNKYYNTSEDKKYNVVLNIINNKENITPENLKIISIMPLSDEDTAIELSMGLLSIIFDVVVIIVAIMAFMQWACFFGPLFYLIFKFMTIVFSGLLIFLGYCVSAGYQMPVFIQKGIVRLLQ